MQALAGLVVLLQFNSFSILTGILSLGIVAIYPFMKRFTHWPQLVLGLAFSWGALMGWTAEFADIGRPAILLYLGSIFWVIGYDTIYAHQDKEDDALVGVKSTALLFGDSTKSWLIGLYAGALILMASAFSSAQVPVPAMAGLLAAGAHMARQIIRARHRRSGPVHTPVQVQQCRWLADLPRTDRRRRLDGGETADLTIRGR